MIDMNTVIQRLVFNEGCVLHIYKDHLGKETIGIGRCLETNPLTTEEKKICGDITKGITKNDAFFLCRNDIYNVCKALDRNIPWWRNLNQDRQYVLIDLVFNLGIDGVKKFKKFLQNLQIGNYEIASCELLDSKYANQVQNRANRNARCIRTGKYTV